LFPRYLFIELDLDRDRWLSVRSTIGVASLFTSRDGSPIAVPAGVVEALLARFDGQLVRFDVDLKPGQRVRLLSGPFADFVGTIERLDNTGRVRVLLELMNAAMPITVDGRTVAPAG
jgi:transcriptional antiterminator RfaH